MKTPLNNSICSGNCQKIKELNDDPDNDFMARCTKIGEEVDRHPAELPKDTISHYTNFSGLKGIIETRCLWLTDYKHLNDSSEIHYACDKIVATIRKIYFFRTYI